MVDSDRRESQRKDLKVRVTVEIPSRLQEFYSRNLSEGGLMLESDNPPAVGTEVTLNFEIPGLDKPLSITARVVRHHALHTMGEDFNTKEVTGVGLAFVNLTDEEKQLINQYVSGKGVSLEG